MRRIVMAKWRRGAYCTALVSLATVALLLMGCTHTDSRNARIPSSSQSSGPSQTPKSSPASGSSASLSLQGTRSKKALCQFVSSLDSAVNKANTSSEALVAITPFATQFDAVVSEAPLEIRPNVEKVVEALRQALEAGSFDTVDASSAATGSSAYKLDAYCGIK